MHLSIGVKVEMYHETQNTESENTEILLTRLARITMELAEASERMTHESQRLRKVAQNMSRVTKKKYKV